MGERKIWGWALEGLLYRDTCKKKKYTRSLQRKRDRKKEEYICMQWVEVVKLLRGSGCEYIINGGEIFGNGMTVCVGGDLKSLKGSI